MTTRTTTWNLTLAAFLAAALAGVVSYGYAQWFFSSLDEEWLPIPEHIAWMFWLGAGLMILGGLGALVMLVMRHQRLARA